MGIRGLTTFIQSRSHLYMDNFELHDTNLVIDGNAIACQLYRYHCPGANDCFGGDYDKYGKVIKDFFQLLSECNVTPYVVFDGGYEKKKVATVISRMKNKITTAAALDSVSEGSYSLFPLFLKDCFEEILTKLGVKKVRCDFEGDLETANLARTLNCPVLSYDSDFFIFDVLYIPFVTFDLKSKVKKVEKNCFRYISCQVYKIDKFLNSYGGMDKSNLPILAVLLGNDYVRRSVFSLFFQNLKIQKCQKNQNEQQRRIKSLIVWLQNETIESAIRKVLSRYKKHNRQKVFDKIQKAIEGYYCSDSKYLKYFDIEIKSTQVKDQISFAKILDDSEETDVTLDEDEQMDTESDTEALSGSEEETLNIEENVIDDKEVPKIPTLFLEKFRKCIYPPCFMDIISQNRYYCLPQVENITLNQSHSVSYDILSAIHKIITNSASNNLVSICRIQNTYVGKEVVPICEKKVPYFAEIESLSQKDREIILLDILNIEENFINASLNLFPKSWSLLILAIKFLVTKSNLSFLLIYSLILSKIILEHIDGNVGFCRNKKSFDKKFANKLKAHTKRNITDQVTNDISTAISDMSQSDSLYALSKLLIYFEMEEKMKTHRRSFDRNLVHTISQFQSCLLHIKYLNSVLNYPFSDIFISQTLNCTFVYNFTINLKKRTNCDNYLDILLGDSPTVLYTMRCIISNLKSIYPDLNVSHSVIKKRRKKRKQLDTTINKEESYEENSDEPIFDPNNKFAVLAV